MIRGWAICTTGWTGTVTCGSDVATATAYGLAISQALLLESQGLVTLQLRDSGVFRITRGSSFAVTGTGNMGTRLGFTLPSSSAASHTAGSVALALTPHDYTLYDPGSAFQGRRGVTMASHAIRRARGANEWREPRFAALMTPAQWLAVVEDWNAYLTTPAEIDIIEQADDGTLSAHRVQADGLRFVPQDGPGWIGQVQFSCTEAVS